MTAKCISARPPSAGARICLGCRKPFASAGPHERICPRCKESEEWLAGAAEFPLRDATAPSPGE